MLLTLAYQPSDPGTDAATVFGFLLHKHPDKVQTFPSPAGTATVFYPEASPQRCTVALLIDVDPVALVRNKRFRGDAGELGHYVNDRAYVASSLLAQAIGQVFRTAMTGRSDSYPEFAARPLPLTVQVPVVAARVGGAELVRRLFEPCGWTVDVRAIGFDEQVPDWGDSPYCSLTLRGEVRLAVALRQLYVLLPVLDDAKHYWVNEEEIAKLERNGEGWLAEHPERRLITERYLVHQRSLTAQLADDPAAEEAPTPLRVQRAEAVVRALHEVGARRVIDMGCGPGALLARLASDRSFTRIAGVDVSARALDRAEQRLGLAEASDAERERLELLHGSVVYRDERLRGYDAMVLMEVIEHVEPDRLEALEDAVFAGAAPAAVIVTTPNADYNPLYAGLAAGQFRHDDHRFEWSRAEFAGWCAAVAARHGYRTEFRDVGPADAAAGPPTQLAIFRKGAAA